MLIAADDSPDMLRAAMQAGLRDVVSLPLSLEQLEGSVRAASQWSRTMRDRVAGEESAGGGARRPADRRGRRQGRRRHHHRLPPARARRRARRARAGRSASSTSTSRRATSARSSTCPTAARWSTSSRSPTRSPCATCRRRCTRTRRASASCSRPTTASAPRRSTRWPRGRSSRAVKARHALTIVDLGAQRLGGERDRRRDRQPRARRHPARRRLAARRQAAARAVEAPAGARGRRGRARRAQPRLAQARGPARPRAQGRCAGRLAKTTIPADFSAFEAAVNTGTPARMEDAKLRASFDQLLDEADARPVAGEEPEHRPVRAARPAGAARRRARPEQRRDDGPAAGARLVSCSRSGRSACSATRTCWPATRRARARASSRSTRPTPRRTSRTATPPRSDLPKAWRKDAKIEIDKDDPVTVNVRLDRPGRAAGAQEPVQGLRPRLDVGRGRAAAGLADPEADAGRTSHEGAPRATSRARPPPS